MTSGGKPYEFRCAFLVSSWLGPVVALIGLDFPLSVVTNLKENFSNGALNRSFIIGGLILVVILYVALFISPWVIYEAKEFKYVYGFGCALAVTIVIAYVLSSFEVSWSLRGAHNYSELLGVSESLPEGRALWHWLNFISPTNGVVKIAFLIV